MPDVKGRFKSERAVAKKDKKWLFVLSALHILITSIHAVNEKSIEDVRYTLNQISVDARLFQNTRNGSKSTFVQHLIYLPFLSQRMPPAQVAETFAVMAIG